MKAKMSALFRNYRAFLILFFLGLTPIIWFWKKGDVLINGVDTNFPLDPLVWFARRLFVWNPTLNAGADFSSSTAGLFFHLIQVVPYLLGLNLQTVQIVSFVFWFVLIVFSAFIFARIILPKRLLFQLLFTVLYSFNIYLFNSWENVKVANLSLLSGIPLGLTILTLLKDRKTTLPKAIFYSALIGIIISGSGINPSYFIMFFIVMFIYFVGFLIPEHNWRQILHRSKEFILVSLIIILTNSFWLLPTINFISQNVGPSESIDKLGFNNWVQSLSENTSLVNVLRMQGAWDWYAFDQTTGFPLYIPYVLNYFYRLPFLVFSFLVPGIAILSLIFRNKEKNYLYMSFGLMLVIGVFLCAGTHSPTGGFFSLLLDKLPFFSLFRSPWYIFAPLVGLSTAALVSLFAFYLNARLKRLNLRVLNYLVPGLSFILIVGNLVYCYPLVTGKIFRPGRKDGFYVRFPDYIFQAQKWLASEKPQGRVIEYPDDEIVEFSWGYRGIESILNLFSGVDSLFLPLNASDSKISKLIKAYYVSLKKGALEASSNLAYKIGADFLFEKKDVNSLAIKLPIEVEELPKETFTDKWFFYKLFESPVPRIYPANDFYFGLPFAKADALVSLLPRTAVLVNSEDTVVKELGSLFRSAGKVILAENLQMKDFYDFSYAPSNLSNRLVSRDLTRVNFSFTVPEDGLYSPVFESYRLSDFGISPQGELKIKIDSKEISWRQAKLTDSYVYFDKIMLKKGNHQVTLSLNNKNLLPEGNFDGEVKFKEGGYGEGKALYQIQENEPDNSDKFLSILNVGKADVSADFSISDFDPLIPYYVEIKYKQIYGNNALALAGQNNERTLIKAQTERLPNYPEWNVFSFYYEPVKTDSVMKVNLSAPFTKDPLGTKVFYDDLAVYKVFANNLMFIKDSQIGLAMPEIETKKISAVKYRVLVKNTKSSHVLIFSENYSPEWQVKYVDKKLGKITNKHLSANLFANAWFLENTPSSYELEIYYQPQRLFYLGIGTAALIMILVAVIAFVKRPKRE